jgi:endonuclease/exonuclease/phosphatase family metal-dependent hydrolase
MLKIVKKLLKIIAWLLLTMFALFIGFMVYITLSDYQPKQIEIIVDNGSENENLLKKDTISLINWNIGYGGLGSEMDFFYDGGKGVRASKDLSDSYFRNIVDFIVSNDTVDFWLLQEVDVCSKRSYKVNQIEEISEIKKERAGVFAMNYKCSFVPVPVYEPMGFVESGLLTLSIFPPENAVRYSYPLIASWPDKLFLLDRCFMLNRYSTRNGKDVVVINTHNSAYVYDSILRIEELLIIREVMLEEYAKGNYVIAGGDWNQNPPGYKPVDRYNGHKFTPSLVKMNDDFMPADWLWVFDESAPTNRSNDKPYKIGENETSCLDYYLVSPNIEVVDIEVIDLEFKDSDHNPVYLKVHTKAYK